ncbi:MULTISPECIES: p-hydroxycinnamoyl CoA hydratase/lyase [Rhodococcus]|uniref:p-hydroxycinnamoyl CoA hydratase/lyase n=1 Tax=Rhodococcus TaxID=1827 RepID=UPI0021BB59C8|nr:MULTISPECIES: p-hydroxycinnamoyl CoA hydratase/lyase [Rhodococcus]MBQ7804048.1 p-hydroxycinnamoyl CoA hydratase/lyase [Rhodococcus sp. (in: high G+C Gram-positive bacteria)]UXF67267.1 p-hydroxycinnamoyl CoA hydratase/lyase [Rhodococcus qingshengii]
MSAESDQPWGETVRVEIDDNRIAWVYFNRPDKRNAMNPTLNREMFAALDALEDDDRVAVVVLTGSGESFSAGMDLKEYFRETDGKPRSVQHRVRAEGTNWQYRKLLNYAKPTIAMVNGWCFGGAFVPLVSCDLAISSDDATFGLSEVNWGVTPGNLVTRALAETIPTRDAMFYIMTGQQFDGQKAAQMRLVNESVPAAQLRERTIELALQLTSLSQWVVRGAKMGFRHSRLMSWEAAEDYLYAKHDQAILFDTEAREQGMTQFLDDKTYRPGLGTYATSTE